MAPSTFDLFNHEFKKEVLSLLRQQLALLEKNIALSEKILSKLPQPLTARIAVQFKGDSGMSLNALTLNVGQSSQASIVEFLADGVTPSGGVPSNVAYTFNDPSATVTLNADGLTATVTGMAASTNGAVSGAATCTITDTDGVVSQWTQAFTITVNVVPPPPAQITQSIAVSFTTPTP